jgi:hypothetical protein
MVGLCSLTILLDESAIPHLQSFQVSRMVQIYGCMHTERSVVDSVAGRLGRRAEGVGSVLPGSQFFLSPLTSVSMDARSQHERSRWLVSRKSMGEWPG